MPKNLPSESETAHGMQFLHESAAIFFFGYPKHTWGLERDSGAPNRDSTKYFQNSQTFRYTVPKPQVKRDSKLQSTCKRDLKTLKT